MSEPSSLPARIVHLVSEAGWPIVREALPPMARGYAASVGFKPMSGRVLVLPGETGTAGAALLGIGSDEGLSEQPFLLGKLATDLPAGPWRVEGRIENPTLALTGFYLGQYRFDRFKTVTREAVSLQPIPGADIARARLAAEAVSAGRDLINRPANDLTTEALALAARELGERFRAEVREIIGEELLAENLPMIHAVGAASAHPPRLVDLTWGDLRAPKVTLVGKGVVFDTGGLNLKPENSMLLMKKDMGGAAAAMAAAEIIMGLQLPVRLRVLLPIVENSISGPAFRPGDIYRSRAGTTIEIGNTDAEGRLILCDALTLADEEKPDLLMDFATLTGAARVALGPDLPPFFTDDDELAESISRIARDENDPVWRLPLWKPYRTMLDSKSADINNVSSGGFAGAITAAVFLKEFVRNSRSYVHFDIYGWTPTARPGRPEGGEPQAARLAAFLVELWSGVNK
ncbi:MAG: leucyl aminopeptidase family protein [Methylobacterium sp.]|nr:leucyl aminopeptidase family protein [Methylobacterium sp.]MCA3603386.1 leucyl aminopeptidase family protein [Methylobacterium sp.]MCA4909283.1 leucyl aminopeptidase family protein [Methylobacterium sp.]